MLDLGSYAQQYRHFERCLPEVLASVADGMEPGETRGLVEANLEDELTNPRPHLELFDDFSGAVGGGEPADCTSATAELVRIYEDAARRGPTALLAVVAAYEVQAAEIAATKAASLSGHYGLDGVATRFWAVHAVAEVQHSAWTVEALHALGSPVHEVTAWATRSAEAWWRFLDERNADRADRADRTAATAV